MPRAPGLRSLIIAVTLSLGPVVATEEDLSKRTTAEVFMDHLRLRLEGKTEEDIQRNYSENLQVITNYGNFTGHDGLRRSASILNSLIPTRKYKMNSLLFAGDVTFEEWSVDSDELKVTNGIDAFIIRDGKIIVQTIYYCVEKDKVKCP